MLVAFFFILSYMEGIGPCTTWPRETRGLNPNCETILASQKILLFPCGKNGPIGRLQEMGKTNRGSEMIADPSERLSN